MNFTVVENLEGELEYPKGFSDLSFYSDYLPESKNLYRASLCLIDISGKCELKVWKNNIKNPQVQTSTLIIDEFKNIKKLAHAYEFYKDFKLYVNEKTGDYYIFHTILRKTSFLSFNIYKGNLENNKINRITYLPEDLGKYNLDESYFKRFSIDGIKFYSDQSTYDLQDNLMLSFHSRETIGQHDTRPVQIIQASVSGITIRTLFTLSLHEGKIVKAEKQNFPFNCIKHNQFLLLPEKTEELYKTTDYKSQESDYIYYNYIGKVDPKDNLFRILKRDGYSFIVHLKKENSEVEVTKLTFK